MEFNTSSFISSVVLASNAHNAKLQPFRDFFIKHLGQKTTLDACINFTEKFINSFKMPKEFTNDNINKYLIFLDLKEILSILHLVKELRLDDIEKTKSDLYEKITPEIKKLGFDFEMPVYKIVDDYEGTWKGADFSAMNYDQEDAEAQGLKPGIYFKRKHLCPLQSHLVLPHELFHQLPAYYDPKTVPQLLEEGLGDLLGIFYLGKLYFDKRLLKTYLINKSNKGYIDSWIWERYYQGLRVASFLYQKFGLKEIIKMIKQGRRKINEIEELLMSQQFEKIELLKGEFDKDLDLFTNILLSTPRFMNLSPMAFYLGMNIRSNEKLIDLQGRLRIEKSSFLKGIDELKKNSLLLVIDKTVKHNEISRFKLVMNYSDGK